MMWIYLIPLGIISTHNDNDNDNVDPNVRTGGRVTVGDGDVTRVFFRFKKQGGNGCSPEPFVLHVPGDGRCAPDQPRSTSASAYGYTAA